MTLGIALAEVLLLGFGAGIGSSRSRSPSPCWWPGSCCRTPPSPSRPPCSARWSCSARCRRAGRSRARVDALVGGAFALLATALIPRDPRQGGHARRPAACSPSTTASWPTSRRPSPPARRPKADAALARARAHPAADRRLVERRRLRRRHRAPLAVPAPTPVRPRAAGVDAGGDRAVHPEPARRRAPRGLRRPRRRRRGPLSPTSSARVRVSVELIGESLTDVSQQPLARQSLIEVARHLDPARAGARRRLRRSQPRAGDAALHRRRPRRDGHERRRGARPAAAGEARRRSLRAWRASANAELAATRRDGRPGHGQLAEPPAPDAAAHGPAGIRQHPHGGDPALRRAVHRRAARSAARRGRARRAARGRARRARCGG